MGNNPYANQGLAQNTQQAGTQAGSLYADMTNGQGPLANTNYTPYMNPFTQNVVNTTMGEMGRQQQIQGNSLADQATRQNAFGGDRFGIQQAENDRNWNAQKANTLSSLYNTGWNQAQGMAQQDISNQMAAASGLANTANMGFGWGNQLQQNQLAAGKMQQDQTQALMDAIKGQYQGFTGQGMQSLQDLISAIQGFGSSTQKSKGDSSSSQVGLSGGK